MHTANASRTRWFLHLRSLLDFPGQFLAPTRTLLRSFRALVERADQAHSHAARISSTARTDGRPKASLHLESSRQSSSHVPVIRGDILPKQFSAPNHHQRRPKAPIVQGSPGARTTAGSLLGGTYDSSLMPQKSDSPIAPQDAKPRFDSSFERMASPTRGPVVQFLPARRASSVTAAHLEIADRSSARMKLDALLRAQPPVGENPSGSEQFGAATPPPRPNESDYTSEDETETPKTSASSVVHIDGTALGRWAVQHLERVLGKPTNGMTGVDPRAGSPRNRVSPF
jgi:hypothetical protein